MRPWPGRPLPPGAIGDSGGVNFEHATGVELCRFDETGLAEQRTELTRGRDSLRRIQEEADAIIEKAIAAQGQG